MIGTAVPGSIDRGRDYVGTETSLAEMQFNVGSAEEREADKEKSRARNDLKPHLLRVDDQDLKAIGNGMPGYIVHELLHCAKRVVQSPTAIFQGLRRTGRLASGLSLIHI